MSIDEQSEIDVGNMIKSRVSVGARAFTSDMMTMSSVGEGKV